MEARTEQIKRFLDNPMMAQAVYELLYEFFHKRSETKDVPLLATERLSQNKFEDAWRVLQSYKNSGEEKRTPKQVGL